MAGIQYLSLGIIEGDRNSISEASPSGVDLLDTGPAFPAKASWRFPVPVAHLAKARSKRAAWPSGPRRQTGLAEGGSPDRPFLGFPWQIPIASRSRHLSR